MIRIGSLFSGAGGLDLAVEHVFGGRTVWHCENDPAASKVLAHRWSGVPNLGDITAVDWSRVEPVDVVCAGWPCQPFSTAGKRRGAADERALWPYLAGAVRVLRPRIIVLENVPAVLGPEFSRVADSLATLGYDLRWTCLRASDIGAPHRRERLFIVAIPGSAAVRQSAQGASAEEAWTQTGNGSGDHRGERVDRNGWSSADSGGAGLEIGWPVTDEPKRPQHVGDSATAADSSGDGRNQKWPEPALLQWRSDAPVGGAGPVTLLPTPNAQDGNGGGRYNSDGHQSTLPGEVRLLPTPRSTDRFGAGEHGGGGLDLRTAVSTATDWGKYTPAVHRWEQLTRPAPPPTEPNRNGKPRLNPAFSEWMMGWPADWVTNLPISRNDQLRIIGNGVVPRQAVAALRYLLSISETM